MAQSGVFQLHFGIQYASFAMLSIKHRCSMVIRIQMGGDLENQHSLVILPCLFLRTQPQRRSLCGVVVKPLAL